MSKPISRSARMGGVVVRLVLAAVLVSLVGAAGAAHADNPVLIGDVGQNDSYAISLTMNGTAVTHLSPGTYDVTLRDHSAYHNFHLSGPGVDVSTSIDGIENKTATITLTDGTYFYVCDAHAARMKGTFTVGTASAPPPAPKPVAPRKLAASIGPGTKTALGPLANVSPGKFTVTVNDRSATDGFRLSGPGVSRTTTAAFRGTVKWTVTLKAGRYSYGSSKNAKARRTFTVSG